MRSSQIASSTSEAVWLADIGKTFAVGKEEVQALEGVSLEIRPGEFVSLLGPSGCGKSTLLSLISGLETPTEGEVRVDGKAVTRPMTQSGVVFQKDLLMGWKTALDNILMQFRLRGEPWKDKVPHATRLLEQVGLKGFEKKYPKQLSGGMRQRVAICRALVHDPALLLMDEPFGALDALTRDKLNLDLARICEGAGKTVVFVTHSMEEAIFLSDRVIVMSPRPGRVVLDLAIDIPRPRTSAIYDDPRFQDYLAVIRKEFERQGVLSDV